MSISRRKLFGRVAGVVVVGAGGAALATPSDSQKKLPQFSSNQVLSVDDLNAIVDAINDLRQNT